MTLVSNDPSWWPVINASLIASYFTGSWSVSHMMTVTDLRCHFVVASSVGIIYDWGLTFGKEIELIWRQRWSLMTFLYLSVRYTGIGFAVIIILIDVPTISTTDALNYHAGSRYWARSRQVLIFLVVIFLAITITNVVMIATITAQITGALNKWDYWGLLHGVDENSPELLCEMRLFSPTISTNTNSLEHQIYLGPALILQSVQLFVLGPRLILGVREYHAELMANSDTASAMTSIVFQERVHVSTSSSV
ncbi:hypothetical protein BD769DRAFT_1643113 [Suillus cothurnatus]|nr:hypothetical protein BD769DRAFT_1643113 [Suillus cothurnatus]